MFPAKRNEQVTPLRCSVLDHFSKQEKFHVEQLFSFKQLRETQWVARLQNLRLNLILRGHRPITAQIQMKLCVKSKGQFHAKRAFSLDQL